MVGPLVPARFVAPLRSLADAGNLHRAQRKTRASARDDVAEYRRARGWGAEVCCHLASAGEDVAADAAARGFKATWTLRFGRETRVVVGDVWRVRGETAGETWERLVTITGDLKQHGRVFRLVAAVDVALNNPTQGTT